MTDLCHNDIITLIHVDLGKVKKYVSTTKLALDGNANVPCLSIEKVPIDAKSVFLLLSGFCKVRYFFLP